MSEETPLEPPSLQIFTSVRHDPILTTSPSNALNSHPPSPFYMLPHHRDRLLSAAQHFNWPPAITMLSSSSGLSLLTQTLHQTVRSAPAATKDPSNPDDNPGSGPGPLKIRFLVSRSGEITTEHAPTPAVPLAALFPSSLDGPAPTTTDDAAVQQPPWRMVLDTQPTLPSPYTLHKTTFRDPYTEARSRAGITSFASRVEVLLYSPAGEVTEGSLTSVYFFRRGRWVTPPVGSGGNRGTTRRWALEKGLCVEEVVRAEDVRDGEGVWVSNGVRGFIWGLVSLDGEGVGKRN